MHTLYHIKLHCNLAKVLGLLGHEHCPGSILPQTQPSMPPPEAAAEDAPWQHGVRGSRRTSASRSWGAGTNSHGWVVFELDLEFRPRVSTSTSSFDLDLEIRPRDSTSRLDLGRVDREPAAPWWPPRPLSSPACAATSSHPCRTDPSLRGPGAAARSLTTWLRYARLLQARPSAPKVAGTSAQPSAISGQPYGIRGLAER